MNKKISRLLVHNGNRQSKAECTSVIESYHGVAWRSGAGDRPNTPSFLHQSSFFIRDDAYSVHPRIHTHIPCLE